MDDDTTGTIYQEAGMLFRSCNIKFKLPLETFTGLINRTRNSASDTCISVTRPVTNETGSVVHLTDIVGHATGPVSHESGPVYHAKMTCLRT